ncbi:MAG: hypothetical protein K1X75_11130 [Leptospirales bacterium]|nr:hypothetical protein [Leptospirales bacterium]
MKLERLTWPVLAFLALANCLGISNPLDGTEDEGVSPLAWLLAAAPAAVPGQIPGFDPANPQQMTSQYVVAEQGATLYLNNEVQLHIPPGSLEEDTLIEIRKLETPTAAPMQGFHDLGQAYELLPSGTTFDPANPATLQIRYNAVAMADASLDPQLSEVMYYNEENQSYIGVPNYVDVSNGTITAEVTHFTQYIPAALGYQAASTAPRIVILDTFPATPVAGAPLYVRVRVEQGTPQPLGAIAEVNLTYQRLLGGASAPVTVEMQPIEGADPALAGSTLAERFRENVYGYMIPASVWASDPCTAGQVGAGPELSLQVSALDNVNRTASSAFPQNINQILIPGTAGLHSRQDDSALPAMRPPPITAGFYRTYQLTAQFRNACGGPAAGTKAMAVEQNQIVPFPIAPGAAPEQQNRAIANPAYNTITVLGRQAGDYSLLVNYTAMDAPFLAIKILPGQIKTIQVLDTNGAVPAGPIVVYGRDTYAMDARGVDAYGNYIPILPSSWNIDAAGGAVDANGVVSTSNNPVIANVSATLGAKTSPAVQLNIIPRFRVTANVTGLVGTARLSVDGNPEPATINADGVYPLTGWAANYAQVTVGSALNPFMGACNGEVAMVVDADLTVPVRCVQIVSGNVYSATPPVIPANAKAITAAGAPSAGAINGVGGAARFHHPNGVTTDGRYIYIADQLNHAIRRYDTRTAIVDTLAGASYTSGSLNGPALGARFNEPYGITTDGSNLFVTEIGGHTVRKIDLFTRQVSTVAGVAGSPGITDNTNVGAQFNQPRGIITDGAYLYVADLNNHAVRRINLATQYVDTLVGTIGLAGDVLGTGATARIYQPQSLATDGSRIFLAHGGGSISYSIRQIDPATRALTAFAATGEPSLAFGAITYAGGILYMAQYTGASDGGGPLYRLRTTDASGSPVGFLGTDPIANDIYGLTFDGNRLYAAEWRLHRLHFIQ